MLIIHTQFKLENLTINMKLQLNMKEEKEKEKKGLCEKRGLKFDVEAWN